MKRGDQIQAAYSWMRLAALLASSVVFLFMTFTTFGYVDAKHNSVLSMLAEIRASVKITEQRVYDLAKQRGLE